MGKGGGDIISRQQLKISIVKSVVKMSQQKSLQRAPQPSRLVINCGFMSILVHLYILLTCKNYEERVSFFFFTRRKIAPSSLLTD